MTFENLAAEFDLIIPPDSGHESTTRITDQQMREAFNEQHPYAELEGNINDEQYRYELYKDIRGQYFAKLNETFGNEKIAGTQSMQETTAIVKNHIRNLFNAKNRELPAKITGNSEIINDEIQNDRAA